MIEEQLKYYLSFYGYHYLECIDIDERLLIYLNEIGKISKPEISYPRIYMSKNDILKESKSFLDSRYMLRDVRYLESKEIEERIERKVFSSDDDIIKEYNSLGKIVSPYELPVIFLDEPNSTLLQVKCLTLNNHINEILKKLNISYGNIYLENTFNSFTSRCYIHELTHTQLFQNKDSILNYNDEELLSIYNELLFAYLNKSIYIDSLFTGINDLYLNYYIMNNSSVGSMDYHTCTKYFISTIKAFYLLELSLTNNKYQKEIEQSIQRIFDGDSSLDEMLEFYEINYSNSLDPNIVLRLINK